MSRFLPRGLFLAGFLAAACGALSPPFALAVGILYGLALAHPYAARSRAVSKILLQASVVALGFGMNFGEVLRIGRSGFLFTALGIVAALGLGLVLGRALQMRGASPFLISAGTAICGGSAIAAVGPIVEATDEEMGVSLGTVFLLNAVALFLFPPLGHVLHLSEPQFGLWAALAIHDTSSVVGAAAKYGATALQVGTTVKLVRALWILPVCLLAVAVTRRGKGKVRWPWFVLLFCLAALANSSLPAVAAVGPFLSRLGRGGLTVTLYLIGTEFSREALRKVGFRPLALALMIWVSVALGSLAAILAGWIRI